MIITAPDGAAGTKVVIPVQLDAWELVSATFELDNGTGGASAYPVIQVAFAGATAIILFRVIGQEVTAASSVKCTAAKGLLVNCPLTTLTQTFPVPEGIEVDAMASVKFDWEGGDGNTFVKNIVLNVKEIHRA